MVPGTANDPYTQMTCCIWYQYHVHHMFIVLLCVTIERAQGRHMKRLVDKNDLQVVLQ